MKKIVKGCICLLYENLICTIQEDYPNFKSTYLLKKYKNIIQIQLLNNLFVMSLSIHEYKYYSEKIQFSLIEDFLDEFNTNFIKLSYCLYESTTRKYLLLKYFLFIVIFILFTIISIVNIFIYVENGLSSSLETKGMIAFSSITIYFLLFYILFYLVGYFNISKTDFLNRQSISKRVIYHRIVDKWNAELNKNKIFITLPYGLSNIIVSIDSSLCFLYE